jgi:hypothetical protein
MNEMENLCHVHHILYYQAKFDQGMKKNNGFKKEKNYVQHTNNGENFSDFSPLGYKCFYWICLIERIFVKKLSKVSMF